MTNIFLYGTLCHPGLLELVSGKTAGALAPISAKLSDYHVAWAKGHGFPLIEQAKGRVCEGLLLRGIEAEVLDRLNHYELGFGYELKAVTVETAAGPETAQVYFPQPGLWQAGDPWMLQVWERECWPLTRHSAAEVMGYFGLLSGADVAKRYKMILTRAASRLLAEEEQAATTLRSANGRDAIETVGEEINHAGFFLLKTLHLRHMRFDGEMSAQLDRELFVAGDAATVLPYDPLRDRVLLIEQFRMGPYGRGDAHPWMLEPIAGRIDGFEGAESTALREAEEEAGLCLKRLELIARYYGTPGYSTEMFHSYLGIADLPDNVTGPGGVPDEHEDIRSHVVSFAEAMHLVETGEANNGPLILSLLWLARERERVRAEA